MPEAKHPVVLYSGPAGESVSVVKRLLEPHFSVIRAEPEEVLAHLPLCHVFLDASMKTPLSAASIAAAKNLALVVTATTGTDHIDERALAARSIPLLTLKGQIEVLRNLTGAAELSWLLLLACARLLRGALNHVEEGGWDRVRFPGTMLRNKTLGVIGLGRIGSWMGRYGAAFEMKVIAADPLPQEVPPHVTIVPLDKVLSHSDFITIHVHLTDGTRKLINRERIKKIKRGAVLINTSRGEIVDEAAVVEALENGGLSAVGVDVLSGEPAVSQNPLWQYAQKHDNVIITPHIGGFCPESVDIVLEFSCHRIIKFFKKNGPTLKN